MKDDVRSRADRIIPVRYIIVGTVTWLTASLAPPLSANPNHESDDLEPPRYLIDLKPPHEGVLRIIPVDYAGRYLLQTANGLVEIKPDPNPTEGYNTLGRRLPKNSLAQLAAGINQRYRDVLEVTLVPELKKVLELEMNNMPATEAWTPVLTFGFESILEGISSFDRFYNVTGLPPSRWHQRLIGPFARHWSDPGAPLQYVTLAAVATVFAILDRAPLVGQPGLRV